LDSMFGVPPSNGTVPAQKQGGRAFAVMQNNSTQEQTFLVLLRIFDELILNTHKSKYTQFLIFYVCKFGGEHCPLAQRFVAHLLHKVMDPSNGSSQRMASCAYLGSFLARAQFIPIGLVHDTMFILSGWAAQYQEEVGTDAYPDVDKHGVFYMAAQSSYYVFCFRHRALAKSGNLVSFADPLRRLSECRLNPLKFCLPTVVREFSHIIGTLRWFSADEIVARNQRIFLSTKTSIGGSNQLESFFPFDPYLLKNSSNRLTALYNVWQTITQDDDTDETDSSSEEELESEEENENASGTSSCAMSFTEDVEQDLKFHFSLEGQ